MVISNSRYIVYTAVSLTLLSLSAISVNALSYHFPGNNYFPPNIPYIALSLILMYVGFWLQFGVASQVTTLLKELILLFIVMFVLALATTAAQYTPFATIDQNILNLETSLHIDMEAILSWTHSNTTFKKILGFLYDTLPSQMIYIPLIIIVMRKTHYIREYYFFMLISAALGFTFYYFFPTTAPASIINSPYFSEAQRATGLKFMQIHQHIQPSTIDGGMIALPSFHVIWAWFCLYLLRGWPILFVFMLIPNTLLVASCVLLGWHYPIDILGGVVVILLSHGLYALCSRSPFYRLINYPHRGAYINEFK